MNWGLLRQSSRKDGFSLVEVMISAALVGGLAVGVSSLLLRAKRTQIQTDTQAQQDLSRGMLLQKLGRELNQSRVARYLNLPVSGAGCAMKRPGLAVFKGGMLGCSSDKALGISEGYHSMFSDTVSPKISDNIVSYHIVASHQAIPGSPYVDLTVVNQAPKALSATDREVLKTMRADGLPLAIWPLVDEFSSPFIFLRQKELGGSLRFRYKEDWLVQPLLTGSYARYVTLAASRQDLDLASLRGGVSLIVNEAAPDQYFAKTVTNVFPCIPKSESIKECLKVACDEKSEQEREACKEAFAAPGNVTRYLVEFAAASDSLRMREANPKGYLPISAYADDLPPSWMNQDTQFFTFPTQVASLFQIRQSGPSQPAQRQPIVEGDVDLKKIFLRSQELSELRVNWVIVPVVLQKFFFAKADGADVKYNLMSQVFNDDLTAAAAASRPQYVMEVPWIKDKDVVLSARIVFARELGSTVFAVFEDYGDKAQARKSAAVAMATEFLPPLSDLIAEYPASQAAPPVVVAAVPPAGGGGGGGPRDGPPPASGPSVDGAGPGLAGGPGRSAGSTISVPAGMCAGDILGNCDDTAMDALGGASLSGGGVGAAGLGGASGRGPAGAGRGPGGPSGMPAGGMDSEGF